jgi:UDP-N-acetylmuramate-alanine ligase
MSTPAGEAVRASRSSKGYRRRADGDTSPDCFVVGNAVSRGNPLLEEILDRGSALRLRAAVARRARPAAALGAGGRRHARQDDDLVAMLAWILEDAGLSPGFLIGGVPLNFGVSARLARRTGRKSPFLRDRGRRVRYGLLRQALEVRALPPADR